jgi:hypothetical protein
LEYALETRRRVKEQLKKIGGMEFFDVHFSYIDLEKSEEKFITVPEQGMLKVLDRRIGQCWEATPWQNHHRAESMPKASAMGVEAESLPPGKCHLPLATMR